MHGKSKKQDHLCAFNRYCASEKAPNGYSVMGFKHVKHGQSWRGRTCFALPSKAFSSAKGRQQHC